MPPTAEVATAPEFQAGDVVRLRSGGPAMTVVAVHGDGVWCRWMPPDGRLLADSFRSETLAPASPDRAPGQPECLWSFADQ